MKTDAVAERVLPGWTKSLAGAALAIALGAPSVASALTIIPHYGLGSADFTPTAKATLASAITFYETTFTDPITLDIGFFNDPGVLGQTESGLYGGPYTALKGAMLADAKSADDATADAHLPATSPGGGFYIKSANARALGFVAPEFAFTVNSYCNVGPGPTVVLDACIGIGLGITTDAGGSYSLLAVLEHEIDEAMGLGSSIYTGGHFPYWSPEDLFRYASPGTLAPFANNTQTDKPCTGAPGAYFSIDGGVTNLDNFNNCDNGGDYGDWVYGDVPIQVQDAYGTSGSTEMLTSSSVEVRALDVIGYDLATPEPTTLVLLATGFAGVVTTARRRRQNA